MSSQPVDHLHPVVEFTQRLNLRLLAEAESCGDTTGSGAATAADWLAIETRQVRRDARSDLRLAERLEDHQLLSAAMDQGRVNTAQARAIVAALAGCLAPGSSRSPPSSVPPRRRTWSTRTCPPRCATAWR